MEDNAASPNLKKKGPKSSGAKHGGRCSGAGRNGAGCGGKLLHTVAMLAADRLSAERPRSMRLSQSISAVAATMEVELARLPLRHAGATRGTPRRGSPRRAASARAR